VAKKRAKRKPAEKVERPRVVEIPARCPRPKCKSTRRTKRQGVETETYKRTGFDRNGEPYNQQRVAYVDCIDCGHKYAVTSFHFVPG